MIEIRPLQTLDELHACEALQKKIWGFADIGVVPHHLMLTTIKNGGVLLGALARTGEQEELVGFVYGFPGIVEAQGRAPLLKHCSLMCAVVSEHRFQGLGHQLKLAQRETVLAQGIELITWTFDPLVSSNAYFNLHKLGAIAGAYERNLYGDMRDRLNAGLETDRITVEWWIARPRVIRRSEVTSPRPPAAEIEPVNQTEWRSGFLVPQDYTLHRDESRLWVEIPYHWREMREHNLELVKEWRQVTRAIFEHYFARGYWATDFTVIEREREKEKRAFCLLEKKSREELLYEL